MERPRLAGDLAARHPCLPGTARHVPLDWLAGPAEPVRQHGRGYKNLAELRALPGAKLGANDARHQATPSHIQPASPQVNGILGNVRPRLAMAWVCFASNRGRVRELAGGCCFPD